MILSKIIEHKRKEVERQKEIVPLDVVKERARRSYVKSSFKKNISRKEHINLIAEIKKSSPSKGVIRHEFSPVQIALAYQAAGAAALSVLTDKRFFDGDLKHLVDIKKRVALPVLRKEFIIDEYQIYESAAAGADAVLLISQVLTRRELIRFQELARKLGMDVLVEVHNTEEMEKALDANAQIVGINNRDLRDFNVDLATTQKLIRMVPGSRPVVSESGIRSYEQVMFLKSLGVNAVLIGETFMAAPNIGDKVRELMRE